MLTRTTTPTLHQAAANFSLAILLGGALAPPMRAQEARPPAPVSRAGARPAATVLARIGQSAGVTVLADSSIKEQVPLPATAATAETVEQQIAAVVKALPRGTTWAKLYLPAPAGPHAWSGDDVAAYARAQSRLFGTVGAAPADALEILGQRFSAEKDKDLITRLKLKPVYLVTNVTRRTAGATTPEPWSPMNREEWLQLPRDQQKQFGQEQAAQIMNMAPELRAQVLQQMKQQDRFFDSIKDPLEHLLGYEF